MSSANPDGAWTRRRSVRSPGILAAGLSVVAIMVSACSPGAAVSPSASAAAATPTPAASSVASASVSPSASAAASVAAVPNCGTDPVVMNAVFETGFDLPFKLSEEFTKQFPNVTFNISEDQFANLISTTPRVLAGDNPPDLIRLPTMVSLVKDNLLKNLDGYFTAFGWDKFPASQLAQNRVGTDGTARRRLAVCRRPELQPDRRLLQQGAGRADRHDRTAEDRRRVRGPAREGQGRRASADHAVERRRERRRARLPAAEPDGRVRRAGADQRLDLPEAWRDHRHADQSQGRPASRAVDQGRLLPEGRQRHRLHR